MVYRNHMRNKSRPICNHDQNGVTFDPSISVQLTATSRIGIRNACAMYNNSTSNAHRSTCIISNKIWAVRRVNNLKPHWVSRTPRTANSQTRKWKPCIKIVRKKLRVATASSSRWAREPMTIPDWGKIAFYRIDSINYPSKWQNLTMFRPCLRHFSFEFDKITKFCGSIGISEQDVLSARTLNALHGEMV